MEMREYEYFFQEQLQQVFKATALHSWHKTYTNEWIF